MTRRGGGRRREKTAHSVPDKLLDESSGEALSYVGLLIDTTQNIYFSMRKKLMGMVSFAYMAAFVNNLLTATRLPVSYSD